MNIHHRTNRHGYRLLKMFEKGPANAPLTEGGAAIEPYVCPGDELTIGYGCTRWFSGRDVLLTDRIRDEAHAHELLVEQLIRYEDAVRDMVTAPITSNQFSALVCFAFNCGIKGLSTSTLLRHVNARRYDDAADAFGMWLYSTSGQHKQALRGLLRRRYSEAVLWMGYDFEVACSDDAVALVRERPPNDIGTDRVLFKTPFKDVLVVAQRYPLAETDDELILTQPEPSPRAVAVEVAQRQSPAKSPAAGAAIDTPAAASPASGTAVAPGSVPRASPSPVPAAINPAPQPSPPATVPKPPVSLPPSVAVNPHSDMGPTTRTMWVSKRFWGGLLIVAGRLIIVADVGGHFSPVVRNFIGDSILMDWMSGIIVTILGEMLFAEGERKARGPMDTPKRIALMTPPPA